MKPLRPAVRSIILASRMALRWAASPPAAALVGLMFPVTPAMAESPVNLPKACQSASASGRHVVLHFWAPWCGPCMRLEREVFSRGDVQQEIARQFVLVMVNADEHSDLMRQYGVRTLPTDVVLDGTGRVIFHANSAQGASAYLGKLQQVASTIPPRAMAPAVVQEVARSAQADAATNRPKQETPAVAPPPLGLDGFCPVELVEGKRWSAGDRRFGAIHRGRTYLFAGPEQQRRFMADPDRYSPVASGVDTVVASETGQHVLGNRNFGLYYGDRVYLFSSQDSLQRFSLQPERFANQPMGLRR